MEIEHQDCHDFVRVSVRGRVDTAASARLHAALCSAQELAPEALLLDLTGVSHFDTSGVAVLVDCVRGLTDSGRRFAIVPSRAVHQALSFVHLNGVFCLYDRIEDAVRALRKGSEVNH